MNEKKFFYEKLDRVKCNTCHNKLAIFRVFLEDRNLLVCELCLTRLKKKYNLVKRNIGENRIDEFRSIQGIHKVRSKNIKASDNFGGFGEELTLEEGIDRVVKRLENGEKLNFEDALRSLVPRKDIFGNDIE